MSAPRGKARKPAEPMKGLASLPYLHHDADAEYWRQRLELCARLRDPKESS